MSYFINWSDIYQDNYNRYVLRRKDELQQEAERVKASWDPDKQCMKCGDELSWVRMALVCKTHGAQKGC